MNRLFGLTAALLVAAGNADSLRFRQTWFVPRGTPGVLSSVGGFDVNRDGNNELIFSSHWKNPWTVLAESSALLYYTCHPYDRYSLSDSILGPTLGAFPLFSTIGDVDGDSLIDVVVKGSHLLGYVTGVYEAPDLYSFPKRLVWVRRNFTNDGEYDCYITDLDRDSKKEITFIEWCCPTVCENIADNRYRLVFHDTLGLKNYAMAIADYDLDGRMEFGCWTRIGVWPHFAVYENTGPDQYAIIWTCPTRTPIFVDDACSLPDLNHNGKPEMMFGAEIELGGQRKAGAGLFIFESTGDNQFQEIFEDSMEYPFALDATEKRSAFGDIDSDGEVEFVWSAGWDWWVYKWIDPNFVKVHSQYNGNNRCSRTTNLCVYDLNKNGYAEVIEANGDRLKVWEIEGVRLHRPNGGEVMTPGSQFPITWEKFTPPGADSFSLFASYNNTLTFETIKTGLTSNDTLFLWTVPDSLSDSVKLMIWAYGPPRAGQQVPRGTAWDFSDSTFSIRQTVVAEGTGNRTQGTGLRILQNPTTRAQGVRLLATSHTPHARLQVYDVAGKLVRSLVLNPMPFAPCPITLRLSAGVYFVRLEAAEKTITKKVVVVE